MQRARSRLVDVALVVAGLAAGLGLMLFLQRDRGVVEGVAGQASRPDARPAPTSAPTTAPTATPTTAPTTVPGAVGTGGAASPEAAVEAFLAAEGRGDYATSYALLSEADRREHASVPAWVSAHGDLMPLTGGRVERPAGGAERGERADVVALATYRAGLDEVLGLIPAKARVSYPVVKEGGGWRVAFQEARIEPLYPPADAAADAARRWAEARQRCVPGQPASELADGLVGGDAIARRLCGAQGAVGVGEVARLDDGADVSVLLNAFGGEVGDWARVVPVQTPVPVDAVVAPLGDEWTVIAALDRRVGAGA